MLLTDPHDGNANFLFSIAGYAVVILNLIGIGGMVYIFGSSFWKEKGKASFIYASGVLASSKLCTFCCRNNFGDRLRQSAIETRASKVTNWAINPVAPSCGAVQQIPAISG
jgi:hypothetical protein